MAKQKKKKSIKKTKKVKLLKPVSRRKILVIKKTQKAKKIKVKNNKKTKSQKSVFAKISVPRRKKVTIKPIKKIVVKRKIKIKKSLAQKNKKVFGRIQNKTIRLRLGQAKKVKKIVARKIKKRIIKRPKKHSITEFSAESLFKAKIKVIGIGGGGGSIVSEMGRSLGRASFVIADTDIRVLKKKSKIKYFWFGQNLTHGLGTGVSIDLAKQAADDAKEKISAMLKDQDIIIFVASLGGGLGSGATQVFAEVAKEFGGITFGIFTLPFKFEGKNKYRIAQNALRVLRRALNVSLVVPNEKIFKVIDASTPITAAFSTVNKSLIESLESLIDLIYNPGVINIDFADLRTILKGRGNSSFLNIVEESGEDKAEKICQKIFKNPLLQNNSFKAEKVLFNIAGSKSLSMFEVEKISSHIANLNPKSKIIFGISKDKKLKNKIKTTILMTGGQIRENVPVKKIKVLKPTLLKEIEESPKQKPEIIKNANRKLEVAKNKKRKTETPKSEKPTPPDEKEQKPDSSVPVFEIPVSPISVLQQKRTDIVEVAEPITTKKLLVGKRETIRRSGLEIKKAEELQEKKMAAQEKEWEIPAFLRKVKFKS